MTATHSQHADALDAYRAAISRAKPLEPSEERELARRYRDGDTRAGDRLIRANLPFVVSIAREYRRWGIPLEDIIQQGNLGLLKAAVRFDPARECRLVTYAAYWIRAEIREYVVRGYRVVRLGTTKTERKALRTYRKTREADPARLAELSGLSLRRAEQLVPLLVARDVPLDHGPTVGTEPSARLASGNPTPEADACDADMRRQIREALAELMQQLTPREQTIVNARWMRDEPITLERLGQQLGVSKERVRQLEERIASRLRARLEPFRDWAEAG